MARPPAASAELVGALIAAEGHEARSACRRRIRALGPAATEDLLQLLEDPDSLTRWEAVNLLGELAVPETLEPLVAFALDEDEVHARWRSFWAVSSFPAEDSLPLLLSALRSPAFPRRWRAALILSMLGRREEVLPVLLEGLDAEKEWIQWEALSALKSVGTRGVEDRLGPFLALDRSVSLRQEAALALGRGTAEDALPHLATALADPAPGVRRRASMSLARIGGLEARRLLQASLEVESDTSVMEPLREDLTRLQQTPSKNGHREGRTPD